MTIILASKSLARQMLLRQAGVVFTVELPGIDEETYKTSRPWIPSELSLALAEAKSLAVSARQATATVIGADQVLSLDGTVYSKPATAQEARMQLQSLRGRRHKLHSGVACARGGQIQWRFHDEAHLTMRSFSEAFLDDYLRQTGPAALSSVGAYQIEGRGLQLFDDIKGDYFTILGLPLLPLLEFLRRQGELAA